MGTSRKAKVVSYKTGSKAKNVCRVLLENTGRSRGGRASDYNTVRDIAQFGNENGFILGWHLSLLGKMYNRVIGKGRPRSWKRL